MPRGGKRLGAGSAPNLEKTIDLLRRQVDWIKSQKEHRNLDIAEIAAMAQKTQDQVNRLLEIAR